VHAVLDGPADAPPVVLSGSLGSTVAMWQPQLPALAERFRVIRFDTRGHGRSPVPPAPYTIDDLGADALALLDRLGLPAVAWCGVSLGGMVGMWLAAHAPERVHRLVLCCASARFVPLQTWVDRAATVRAAGSTAAIADAVVDRWFTAAFVTAHPDVVERARAMIASTPAEGYAACCGAIERADLRAELRRIDAPTLVLAGRADPATPPGHAEQIVAGIPGSRLVVLPDAAHLANVEQPDAVNRLIVDHLAEEAT
jgi:3-oxoadipate enol-lactonase